MGTVLLGLLVGLSVLRMADGLVSEVNLKCASVLVRKVLAEGAGRLR